MLLVLTLVIAQTASGGPELFERKCIEAIENGRRQDALRACMHAMPASGFDARIAALHANALLMTEEGPPSDAELALAVDLAAKALESAPRDVGIAQTLCAAAQAAQNLEQLRACVARLENIAPEDEDTRAFAAELARLAPPETPSAEAIEPAITETVDEEPAIERPRLRGSPPSRSRNSRTASTTPVGTGAAAGSGRGRFAGSSGGWDRSPRCSRSDGSSRRSRCAAHARQRRRPGMRSPAATCS
jgi:hypothetical protein